MTCDRRVLSFYRDGQLSMEQRYEVDCHLVACEQCTADLRGLMKLAQVIRSMAMEPVNSDLRQNVRRLIAERGPAQRRRVTIGGLARGFAPAVVAASVAVSVIVTFRPGALETVSPAPVLAPAASSNGPLAAQPSVPGTGATEPQAPVAQVPGNRAVTDPRDVGSGPARTGASRSGNPMLTFPVQMMEPAPIPAPIARLYGANRSVRDLLGEAMPGSRTVTLLEQSFQGGLAIWRSDTREIYVLRRDGNSWSAYSDTWNPGDRISVDMVPPPGALVPSGGFGSVWRSTPEIQNRLGWAVYEPRGSGGSIQTFERGMVVWTPHGLLYVLTNDGRWRTFADATAL